MTLSGAILMLTLSLMLSVVCSGQAPSISPSTTMAPLPLVVSPSPLAITPPPMTMTPSPMASLPDTTTPPAMSSGLVISPPAPMAPATAPTPFMMGNPPVTSTPGSAAFKHGSSLAMLALLRGVLLV